MPLMVARPTSFGLESQKHFNTKKHENVFKNTLRNCGMGLHNLFCNCVDFIITIKLHKSLIVKGLGGQSGVSR